ncbi:MAG: hypothetical protein HYT80_04345 [Euryarchaeota archaeon]|nr:hypothetical protein [Euryarchaeota archaeon]
MNQTYVRALTFVGCLFLAAALFGASPPADAQSASGDQRMSDGSRTIDQTGLLNPPAKSLSGLVDNTFRGTYSPSATGTLDQEATLFWTLDGTNPGSGTTTKKEISCVGAPCVPGQLEYSGALTATDFAAAPPNAEVRFILQIRDAANANVMCDPVPNAVACPASAGTYYFYRIDRTKPLVDAAAALPAKVAGSSVDAGITTDDRTPLRFVLRDDNREQPLNGTAAATAITVDGVDNTALFKRTDLTPHAFQFDFDYTKVSASFKWSHQPHKIVVTGKDLANNQVDTAKNSFTFHVDTTPPTIPATAITAVPNAGLPGSQTQLPITARGVNVTVKSDVTDVSLDTNSKTNVFAQHFNATVGAVSPLFPLTYNPTSKLWESTGVTIPLTWPAQEFRVHTRIIATDLAANVGLNVTAKEQFIIDPIPPSVTEAPPPPSFILDKDYKVRATIKDGTGLDTNKLLVRFSNTTGGFKAALPASVTKINQNTFEGKMAREGQTDNWTFTIPAPKPDSVITYFVSATDKAGGVTNTTLRTLTVDTNGPLLAEVDAKTFRAGEPYVFTVTATDAGIGVNASTVKLFFATSGTTFSPLPMAQVGTTSTFTGTISQAVADATTIKYYFEALDLLGTKGMLGEPTGDKHRNTTVDKSPPTTLQLTAPANATTTTFPVKWNATDAGSGVASFTIQARLADPGKTPSIWVTFLNATTLRETDFCGEGNHTYEFRGFATDNVSNSAPVPTAAQATTVVTGAGCPEGVVVAVTFPTTGTRVDNAQTTRTLQVRYTAAPTRGLTPASELKVRVLYSPDNGVHFFELAKDLSNTGSYSLDVASLPSCKACLVRVEATTLSGATANGTSGVFVVAGGSATADLDENGLADSWETRYGSRLGEMEADADTDEDGLSNTDEAAAGTDPNNADTDGDGFSDRLEVRSGTNPLSATSVPTPEQARSEQFTHWYWSVPALFLVTGVLFFVGLARRW